MGFEREGRFPVSGLSHCVYGGSIYWEKRPYKEKERGRRREKEREGKKRERERRGEEKDQGSAMDMSLLEGTQALELERPGSTSKFCHFSAMCK